MLLNVRVQLDEGTKGKSITELIEDVDVSSTLEQGQSINLGSLLSVLRNEYNIPIENHQIFFYLPKAKMFVNCGIEPICPDIKINQCEYESETQLLIKIKNLGVSAVHRLLLSEEELHEKEEDGEMQIEGNAQDAEQHEDKVGRKAKGHRIKERRIGYIIEKVIQWRKHYEGVDRNSQKKYSLLDAANLVKISKKSLDDYLFQIRFGHKMGFNFNEHYNEKVGVLRDFVRRMKKTSKRSKHGKGEA